VGQALGKPTFDTAPAFLGAIGEAIGVTLPPSHLVRCFMDYHLDWLYAALILSTSDGNGPFDSPAWEPGKAGDPSWNVNANQEDVDLLLAFREEIVTHLVMIEAKATSGWRASQIVSKARRLGRVFGDDGQRFPSIEPHFVLMSPKQSAGLAETLAVHAEVPAWMRPNGTVIWTQLQIPADRLVINRCEGSGLASKTGHHWRVRTL